MYKIESIKSDLREIKNKHHNMMVIMLFAFIFFGIFFFVLSNNEQILERIAIIGTIIFFIAFTFFYLREVKSINAFTHIIQKIDSIYSEKQTPEESLKILEEVYILMYNIKIFIRYMKYVEDEKEYREEEVGAEDREDSKVEESEITIGIKITELSLGILYDLKSDMLESLNKEKLILQGGKAKVSEHIRGNETLDQVSKLQRQRLDQQIEQFEELQRVLVKI